MADELEMLESIASDVTDFKKKSSAQIEKAQKEAKDLIEKAEAKFVADAQAQKEAYEKQVSDLNTKLAESGATINQIMEEVKELKAKKGHMANPGAVDQAVSTLFLLKEAFTAEAEAIKAEGKKPKAKHEFTLKAVGDMTLSANLTGNGVATYSNTPAVRGRRKLHYRDLVDVIPSETGIWKFYRQNKPVGEGSFLNQTPGALKSQVDYDLTEVTVNTNYLAGYARIAKQMLQDLPFMQTFLPQELLEDYLRREDYQMFQQLIAAAAGNAAPLTSNVTIEKIIQGIAALAEDDYDANGVVVTNLVWAKILNTKPNDYSLPAGNAVTVDANGNVNVVGVPLFKTNETNIGANQMIIADWTRTKIIQTDGLSVSMSEHDQDNFIRNMITFKAEARVDQAILRPDAFIKTSAGTT